jgi:branched-chain amino acid transport system ATP-binding protein
MARQAVFEAMGRWGLTEKSTVYPAALSFFEERKVELARMQVIHPTLILLDEPSSGFSQSERDELTAALRVFASPQVIVLLVEHDLTMVRTMCNKVVVLNGGRKIVEGHPNVVESLREVRSVLLGAGDNAACA